MNDPLQQLKQARRIFYAALKNQDEIDRAIKAFEAVAETQPQLVARAIIYKGALIGLKAKNAFWPHEKLSYVNQGLQLIDQGLEQGPEDIEALFIHGTACHYLPGYLGRGGDARADFEKIIALLPSHHYHFDDELIADIVQFLNENIDLDVQDQKALATINKKHNR